MRFLENHTLDEPLFHPFFRRSRLSKTSFMLASCRVGVSPLEPTTVLGVTLQGCGRGSMGISPPPAGGSVPPFLAPLCLRLSQ